MTWLDRLLHRGRRPESWLVEEPGRPSTSVVHTQSLPRPNAERPELDPGTRKGGDR